MLAITKLSLPLILLAVILALGVLVPPGHGADPVVTVQVVDQDGAPVDGAVVTLMPSGGGSKAAELDRPAVIDQRDETFVPLVTAVPVNSAVEFRNSDRTGHHAYSFSRAKQFERQIPRGGVAAPVVFETAGVVSIGCNIHDHMIAFVYVFDAPFFQRTGSDGVARFSGVPAGDHEWRAWHPDQRRSDRIETGTFVVEADGASPRVALSIRSSRRGGGRDPERSIY